MHKILFFLLCIFLTACVPSSRGTGSIDGVWVDDHDRLYCLDSDGVLGLPGQTSRSGVSWDMKEGILTLYTLDNPGADIHKQVLTLKKARGNRMEFTDTDGVTVVWKKSRTEVGRLEGTLFYRERMALPPQVIINVQMYPLHSSVPLALSIIPAPGYGPLKFRVYYLEQTVNKQVRLAASILSSGETLFATQTDEVVSLDSQPNILLYRTMPGEHQLAPLKAPVRYKGFLHSAGKKTPVHLYLEDGGLALLTQDGDRNQYMGTWMEKDRNRTIEITRGALKPVTASREAGGGLLLSGLSTRQIELTPADIPWPSRKFLMEGELRNQDGKPVFSECNSQRDIPIIPSGKGYSQLNAVMKENGHASVVLEGRMQEGRLEAANVFLVRKGGVCSTENYASVPLLQTYWRMRELKGENIHMFPGQPEPHLILRDEGQATGSDGCNNFFMGWKRNGQELSFSPGGATLRLCPQGEEQAQAIRGMFTQVDSWSISGSMLELRSKNSVVAVFEAVDM